MTVLVKTELEDKTGRHVYNVSRIHEFGNFSPELTSSKEIKVKIADLWIEASQHEVLFHDDIQGDFGAFLDIFLDKRGAWFEIERETDHRIVGAIYLTDIIPRLEVTAHFAVWDGVAKGRESLFIDFMEYVFKEYKLERIQCEIPAYQQGTIRAARRLGFKEQGQKRRADKHKGEWWPLLLFDVIKPEMEAIKNGSGT